MYLKHKSYIIPNGINKEKFKPATIDYRTELGLNPEKKQVLFLGSRTNVRKNFALVQEAMEHLGRPDAELINPYPVSHEQIPKYLNAADVLVVPSLMEGSPNVIKEAMACNCPIVSTDMGDARWVLGDLEGCYLSSFKPQDFAEKIKHALEYAEKNGRTQGEKRIIELGLDAETIAQRVKGIYQMAVR